MEFDDINGAPSDGKLFNPKEMQDRIDHLKATGKMPALAEFLAALDKARAQMDTVTPDWVCAHCGLPTWDWDRQDEYFCPNGCTSNEIPSTTILRPWDESQDAGKQPPWKLNLTAADREWLRQIGIAR